MRSITDSKKNIEKESVLYEADVNDYLEIIHALDEKNESCMLFGHNPSISETAAFLCGEFKNNLSKGAVVAIKFDINKWKDVTKNEGKLLLFASPKLL